MELELKKKLTDVNQIVKNLFEEIKTIKINMQKENQDSLNRELNYKKEISILKEENKKLWKEINKLNNLIEKNNIIIKENKISNFNSKIIDSINKIDFILNYIKENNITFNFKEIKLLYRSMEIELKLVINYVIIRKIY